MKNYRVVVTELAYEHILSIKRYIAFHLHNPKAAENFHKEIEKNIANLELEPHMYSFASENKKYRKAFVKNYVILFFIDEKQKMVHVSYVFYGKSNYGKYLRRIK